MGTNYYHETTPCKECGEVRKKTHIGKSSFGWSFSFRGYYDTPRSYKQWLEEFKIPNTLIRDEYGQEISVEGFMKLIEYKKDGLNHFRIVSNNPRNEKEIEYLKECPSIGYESHSRECWIDEEGHSFSEAPFS